MPPARRSRRVAAVLVGPAALGLLWWALAGEGPAAGGPRGAGTQVPAEAGPLGGGGPRAPRSEGPGGPGGEEPRDRFSGVLLGLDGGGVEGAWVSARSELTGGVFSGLPCACATKVSSGDDEESPEDAECAPLPGCACEADEALLDFLARDHEAPVAARARTGPGGAFELALDGGSGRYTLSAELPGARAVLINRWLPLDDVVLRAWPADEAEHAVHGTVVDALGRGIPQAPVLLLGERLDWARRAETDAQGAFRFEGVREGGQLLTAVAGLPPELGYASEEGEAVTLRLAAPRRLEGRVVRRGAPAVGVPVQVDSRCVDETTTDGVGRFAFTLPAGTVRLTARAEPWHGAAWAAVEPDKAPAPVTIELVSEGRLEGVVTDLAGRPLAGAVVTWRDPHPPPLAHIRGSPSTRTDGLGRFTIGSKGGARWLVGASAPGHLSTERELAWAEGEVKHERFALSDGAEVAGVVSDTAGSPVRGVQVYALVCAADGGQCDDQWVGETGPDGRFARDDFAPGPARLIAVADRYRIAELPVVLPDRAVRVSLREAATLSGVVLDAQGRPASGVFLELTGPPARGQWQSRRLTLTPSGEFEETLRREGSFRLYAVAFGEAGASVASAVHRFEVGGAAPARAVLRLGPGRNITGTVRDAAGRAVPAVAVLAVADDSDDEAERRSARMRASRDASTPHGRTRTRSDGAFELKGLAPGRYQLWVDDEGSGRAVAALAEAGSSGVQLLAGGQ